LELLLVVAIMAVVVSMTASDLSQLMGRYRLNGAARELASVVQSCRIRAISSNVEFAIVLVESDPLPGNGNSRANRGRYEVRVADSSTSPVTWSATTEGVFDYFAGPNERRGVSIEAWSPLLGAPSYGLPDAVVFSPRGYLLNAAGDFTGGVIRVVLRNKSAGYVERRIVRIDRGGNVRIAAGG
jgi:type II secretory pathway pseudopilin PulG